MAIGLTVAIQSVTFQKRRENEEELIFRGQQFVEMRVAKASLHDRAATTVDRLEPHARREEIARMLAGETITDAARAAADDLLGGAAEPLPAARAARGRGGRTAGIPSRRELH